MPQHVSCSIVVVSLTEGLIFWVMLTAYNPMNVFSNLSHAGRMLPSTKAAQCTQLYTRSL